MELFKSRPRVVYTNAVGDKVYPVVVDIKKGIKSTEDIQFVSSDVNTGILSVAFIQGNDNYNVTGADVVCSVMRPDASTLELPCEVVGENIVEVPLGINGTSQDGVYSFDFKVFKGENKVVGTPIMNYSVSLSISNDMVVEEDDRLPVLTVLMTQLTELKDEARESITQANTATVASREATAKAIEATANANAVSERVSQETSEAITRVDNKVNEVETRFNTLTTSQQQDAEVIDARDGEVSLKARLDRDIEKAKQVYVELEGSYISTESSTGAIQDIEIKGNTVQDPDNLSDIKSVGELQEDGTYKMSILSCGKNLFNTSKLIGGSFVEFKNKPMYKFTDGNKPFEFTGISYLENTAYTLSIRMFRDDDQTSKLTNIIIQYTDGSATDVLIRSGEKKHISTDPNKTVAKIKGAFNYSANVYIDLEDLQIEEGTVATSYEPYQGNKCDILLPCQLEKVGDVSDRLYYDDVEKAWCIEKNVVKIPLYESVHKINGDWETLYFSKSLSFDKVKNASSYCISSLLNYNGQDISTEDTITQLCIFGHANNFECRIRLRKDEFPNITTNEDYIKWATENDFYILLQSASPQKIILPLSTQIALNSFFGTTHVYMESGEVEGTIKCKIPKSLGATVQSLNNKTDILSDRIEAIEGLKDSQNMKYETDKGYLVCKETKNGVVDDLKLEGKTLVNLANCSDVSTSVNINTTIGKSVFNFLPLIKNIENGKTYTSIITCSVSNFSSSSSGYMYSEMTYNNTDSVKKWLFSANSGKINANGTFTLIDKFSINDFKNILEYHLYSANGVVATVKLERVLLLEGDHTQNPPSYFEGLMSVGQDVDKIEVSSVGENLFDMDNFSIGTGSLYAYCKYPNTNGLTLSIEDRDTSVNTSGMYIGVTKIGVDASQGNYWCLANQTIENRVIQTDFSYVSFYPNNRETIETLNKRFKISVYVGKVNKPYTPHQSDKKQILFYNENGELEPIQELHEWDSIEKHSDNKWYYHKRSGEVVFNGSENWSVHSSTYDNCIQFVFPTSVAHNVQPLCSHFKSAKNYNTNIDDEQILIGGSNNIHIRILKSKLSTQDVQGFKQWLQANNVTVVYQLAQEEVYELAPLHLDSYANETLILCNSGAISPKMEFSITSHINELVKSQGDRISLLEEKMYKALKQVLAGDMYSLAELLYPEDFVEENPENEIMLLPFE